MGSFIISFQMPWSGTWINAYLCDANDVGKHESNHWNMMVAAGANIRRGVVIRVLSIYLSIYIYR